MATVTEKPKREYTIGLADTLSELMDDNGITPRALATASGASEKVIYGYMLGLHKPRRADGNLPKIALGLSRLLGFQITTTQLAQGRIPGGEGDVNGNRSAPK